MSTGETDLDRLIAGMQPVLRPGVYAFASLPPGAPAPSSLRPICTFLEDEGPSLVALRADLEAAGLVAEYSCRWISLEIDSALEAVGFLAAITARLAAAGISVNPVSARRHDHLFVPTDDADRAMVILKG
ncbi:MAG: ACT domain-containing protein, partial [Pseudomonadota bacterium]